jgi:hypothetical protein
MTRKKTASTTAVEPVFHPLDLDVPDAAVCLDRLYEVYAEVPVVYGWCRQCFDLDYEEQMRGLRKPRNAPLEAFSQIYFEHPNCSGGPATFLHWLPRGLELAFFQGRLDPDLTELLLRINIWLRPAHEQDALRALFVRVARNWFEAGHTAPLQMPDEAPRTPRARDNVSVQIIEALLGLRVDPAALFAWLASLETAQAWSCLIERLGDNCLLMIPSYYVFDAGLDDKHAKPLVEAGVQAVDRIARHALHTQFPVERLTQLWVDWQPTDPLLAEQLAEAEPMILAQASTLTEAEYRAEEAHIRDALGVAAAA